MVPLTVELPETTVTFVVVTEDVPTSPPLAPPAAVTAPVAVESVIEILDLESVDDPLLTWTPVLIDEAPRSVTELDVVAETKPTNPPVWLAPVTEPLAAEFEIVIVVSVPAEPTVTVPLTVEPSIYVELDVRTWAVPTRPPTWSPPATAPVA